MKNMMLPARNSKWLLVALFIGATSMLSAQDVLPGFFSISPTEQVRFAPGNLQYNYSTGSYQLAASQATVIGTDNATAISSTIGVRDLFNWGEINGMEASGYRVLTEEEWYYLFQTRADAYSLYALATVTGVQGLVILPDKETWTLPAGLSFLYHNTGDGYGKNVYDASQWAQMEAAGALFLPATGYMYFSGTYTVEDVASHGVYWTKTESGTKAYRVQFDDTYFTEFSQQPKDRYYSVRPVKPAPVMLSENDEPSAFETKMTTLRGSSDVYMLRTLRKAGCFNTLTLPFSISDIDASPLAGAEVYEFVGATVEDDVLLLDITPVTSNSLSHSTPYLIQWPNTGEVLKLMHFSGLSAGSWDNNNIADDVGTGNVAFHGFYGKTHIDDDISGTTHLNLFVGANNTLYWPTDGSDASAKMSGFRAYFQITVGGGGGGMPRRARMSRQMPQRSGIYKGMPAAFRIVEQNQTTTDIESAEVSSVYLVKVLQNGHIVIIRNGEMFNINGQKL